MAVKGWFLHTTKLNPFVFWHRYWKCSHGLGCVTPMHTLVWHLLEALRWNKWVMREDQPFCVILSDTPIVLLIMGKHCAKHRDENKAIVRLFFFFWLLSLYVLQWNSCDLSLIGSWCMNRIKSALVLMRFCLCSIQSGSNVSMSV